MLRPATIRDIPQLARLWYAEKAKTCFEQWDLDWSIEGCAIYLQEVIGNPDFYINLIEQDGKIIAACGVAFVQDALPPHPEIVHEWMWFGSDKRATVKVLHDATEWGKAKGAKVLRYVLNSARQVSKHKFCETYQWRIL